MQNSPMVVTITGNVGSGKTPFACAISDKAKAQGLSVVVSDQHLHLNHPDYEQRLIETRRRLEETGTDIAIIVVSSGSSARKPFKLEIDYNGSGDGIGLLNLLLESQNCTE